MSKPVAIAPGQRKIVSASETPDGNDENCNNSAGANRSQNAEDIPGATNSWATGSAAQGKRGCVSRSSQRSKDSKSFEFVLVTDSESRRQVRRYAMRQYVQQRRLDGIARLESTRVQLSGWVKGKSASEPKSSVKRQGHPDNGNHCVAPAVSNGLNQQQSTALPNASEPFDSNCRVPNSKLDLTLRVRAADLKGMSVNSASDPFDSYPVKLNQSDHSLIHHFVSTYPLMMYQMGDPRRDNPIRTIFHRLALHNAVSFQAMLAVAAKHRAGVQGQVETVESLTHKMRAIRLINEHLKDDALGKQDGVLYAVASMAVIEKWSKDPSVERMHFQGVRHLVRRRGGMRGLRVTGQFLENILYWVDFSSAPNAIFCASLPWTGSIPDERPTSLLFLAPPLYSSLHMKSLVGVNDLDAMDLAQSCEDFLSFFRCLRELQMALLKQPLLPSNNGGTRCGKPKLFEPSAPLYDILTSIPDYDHGIRDVRFIDEYTCMACLLYLNVALYDYYFTSRNFNSYLEWINSEIQSSNSRLNLSVASLLWIFLRNGGFPSGETPDEGERSWFVSRMLRIAKMLEWKRSGTIWDGLRRILIQFLVAQQECGLGGDQLGGAELAARERLLQHPIPVLWDEEEMRQIILGELYEGPPIFNTQTRWGFSGPNP
ncbi:hypothetical protein VTO42DRAFT_6281 [Malbranchea cinnamomea]